MVLEAVRGHHGAQRGGQARSVDLAGAHGAVGGVGVRVGVVRRVAADALQHVLEVMRKQVKAAKDEEDAHGEAGEDFGALQAKGVADAAAAPNLEVAEDVDADADGGGADIEEDEVREGGHGQRVAGAEEDVGGDEAVADGPVEAGALLFVHGGPGFFEGGDGKGGGQDGRWPRRGLEEDLVLGADGGVFVAMASSLTNALRVLMLG